VAGIIIFHSGCFWFFGNFVFGEVNLVPEFPVAGIGYFDECDDFE
jgi:hypothetical protein